MALPVVKPELLESSLDYFCTNNNRISEAMNKLMDQLSEENPILLHMLYSTCLSYKLDDSFKMGFAAGFAQVYYMLKKQDECDELNGE